MGKRYFAFKELHVWQRAMEFADSILQEVENLNTDRKHFRLIEQLESAVTSIALNIAEGKGRQSKKEYIQFLYISRGSLYETITLLNIFAKRGWISNAKLEEFEKEGMEITNMLKGLINAVRKSIIKPYVILGIALVITTTLLIHNLSPFTFHL